MSRAVPWCAPATTRTASYNSRTFLTTPEADETGKTAPIELPSHQPPPSPPVPEDPSQTSPAEQVAPPAEPAPVEPPAPPAPEFELADRPPPAAAATREVVYVPLAVSIGDGFKFGCGFFLASVVAGLVGFVLMAALFLLMGVLGLNLPLGR